MRKESGRNEKGSRKGMGKEEGKKEERMMKG
jgi:hypothetical protein